jgi:deoxyribodipyrimidine photolyase-related protein
VAIGSSVWITGDQCSLENSALVGLDPGSSAVLMIESIAWATERPYHKRKLVLIFAVMREFAASLRAQGWTVDYYAERDDFSGPLSEHVARLRPKRLRMMHQSDFGANEAMADVARRLGLEIDITPHTNFISEASDLGKLFRPGQKRVTMETFYRSMRRRTRLLMEGDAPAGGQWNYDARNRKRPRKGMVFPTVWRPALRDSTREVIAMVERRFPRHPGTIGTWDVPITREDALRAADDFFDRRLDDFGPYEDAMVREQPVMYHSALSPLINVGLLHPLELCERAERAYRTGVARIESAEAFIRQLLGWREFVWQLYWRFMPEYRTRNALNADLPIPDFFTSGETDMACMREALGHVRELGWAHHILRLMVLGNFGLIAGFDPQAFTDWFWGMFVDGYDWVMVPNVIGMTLFADGGVMGTKPYAASANYINTMSDYCAGCRYDPKRLTEDDACPFNALYWDFLARNEVAFAANPRMSLVMKNWAGRDAKWKSAARAKASAIRENLRRGDPA